MPMTNAAPDINSVATLPLTMIESPLFGSDDYHVAIDTGRGR